MKTLKSNFLLSLLLIAVVSLTANASEVSKKLNHEFKIDDNSSLTIQNKYGKVDVQNWNEKKVVIDVEIVIEHPDKEKAEKLLEYLDVNFSTSGNECKAITKIDEKFNRLKGNNWGNGKNFHINYTVKMPKNMDMDLYNKYGDVYIDELTGYSKIYVKYGNLQANKIIRNETKPLSSIILGYGKGNITEVGWMKIEIKYSKLKIEKSRALVVQSKYSKLYIDESSSIVSESKYDSYEIGTIDNFVIEGAYSGYKIGYLGKKLSLDTKYTGTTVEKIPASFEFIKISNSYGGIKLGIANDASYHLKGEARSAKISFPSSNNMSRIEKSSSATYDGIVGSSSNPKATVTITTSYGGVKLNF